MLLKGFGQKQVSKKIAKARNRRAATLQRAEQAVGKYKDLHPGMDQSHILSLSLTELTKGLKEGPLTPEDVFYTYMEKTLEINGRLNCCTEILCESFDQLKSVGSYKEGLLYGVPISIKDNIGYKDHDSTCGVLCKLDHPAPADSVVVQVLKRQGAIPFVKTNVPQGLLNYDCSNPIYGQTLNPRNPKKTSGGSSGGEGALIGGGGSLLGLGSDIGGSIRIPASFCGVCGFKPTCGRISSRGVSSCCPGQKSVLASLGPMARDVDSLALCMRALLCEDMFSLDPAVPPVPFNQQVYQSSKPLRIGYYESDGYMQPSPSMDRGLKETKALLERAGHILVPYSPPRISYAMHELIVKGLLGDGSKTLLSNFSVQALWKHNVDVEDYINETVAEWRRCEMDVLLCPVLGPAFNFLYCGQLTCAASYTALYNLLNFPAGAVTVSTVTAEDEEALKRYTGFSKDPWDMLFKRAVTESEGLPVGVQCVALPWQDELCLRFMREVEQLVRQNRND
ncbi:fatty-acid amide hydrolase 1 [Aplochiton taeniatus]